MTLAKTDWRRFTGKDYVGYIQDDIVSVNQPTQCIHSHLSTAEGDNGGFAVEMTVKCTKLKVLELASSLGRLAFSSQSFLYVVNKSVFLETLSLKRVQLSDIVSPP